MENGVARKPTVALFLVLAFAAYVVASRNTLAGSDDAESPAVTGVTHFVPGDFATIQACIDAAQDGDECVVAPGTYYELIDFLGKAITLRSSDGPKVTIIDAGPIVSPVTGKPVVRCVNGEGPDTVLNGFTITGGTGAATIFTPSRGGGMFIRYSSPSVIDCTFIGNTAELHGGGIFNDNSSPTLDSCDFIGNTAGLGGAIYNRIRSTPTVTHCSFRGNTASFGGAICNLYGSSPIVNKCAFTGNTAASSGGAMYNRGSSSPTVTASAFSDNTALRDGGGMCNVSECSPTVANCTFTGNTSSRGGGMANAVRSTPTVTNCTFSGNVADDEGGGLFNSRSNPSLTHTIIWGNTPDDVLNDFAFPQFSYCDVQFSGGSADWNASLGFDAGGNIDADPLFVRNPNPRLNGWDGVDDDFGKLTLKARSPAINAGDPAFVVDDGATDLAGKPRLRGCRIDMGAFESAAGQGRGRGDFNSDGYSDLADFAAFQLCFDAADSNPSWRRACRCVFRDGNGNGGDGGADEDSDQRSGIDLDDLAEFLPAMAGPR